jgi:hypothetical protein
MLELYISYPTKVDFKSLRGLSRSDISSKLRGVIINGSKKQLPPPMSIKTNIVTLRDIKPTIIISEFSKILGVSRDRAIELYEKGARSVDQLKRDAKKYDLNIIQMNGCVYYDDLLYPITESENLDWIDRFSALFLKIEYPVLSSITQSRPNGAHSRMEVLLCIYHLQISSTTQFIIDNMSSHIPPNDISIMEVSNTEHLSRVKCIIKSPITDKHMILDLSVYSPVIHPYPLLRDQKIILCEKGYDLTDYGVIKDDVKINYRSVLGRDNASCYEEILMM